MLLRCREHGITLNKRKFVFAVTDTSFCGYNLSPAGIAADPAKLRAVSEFPAPTNITELRSFLGLVNQLGNFTADIAGRAEALRGLLRPRNTFCWTPTHETAFNAVKAALSQSPTLAPFDPVSAQPRCRPTPRVSKALATLCCNSTVTLGGWCSADPAS